MLVSLSVLINQICLRAAGRKEPTAGVALTTLPPGDTCDGADGAGIGLLGLDITAPCREPVPLAILAGVAGCTLAWRDPPHPHDMPFALFPA
jgi:hypothetical protein